MKILFVLALCAGCVTSAVPTPPTAPQGRQQTPDAGDTVGAATAISGQNPIEHQIHACPDRSGDQKGQRPSVAVGLATDVPADGRKKPRVVTDLTCP